MDNFVEDRVVTITKLVFFEEWLKHEKSERNCRIFDAFCEKHRLLDVSDEILRKLKMKISSLSSKHKDWLEGCGIELTVSTNQPSTSSGVTTAGRPKKSFEDSSLKTKRRRVEDLVGTRNANELVVAAELATRKEGHRSVAKQIKGISDTPKTNKCSEQSRQLTPDEALAYYIDSKLTTHAYKQTRKWSLKAGHKMYPSFYSLSKAKASCCPSDEHISVTETRAEINFQAILNKTVERLIEAQSEVIRSVLPRSSYTLISKWGCDGSSGHSTYKQRFEDTTATDEFLFVYSFVPLRLIENDIVIWQNPRPSSTLYCRPIKFIFAKETTQFTKEETKKNLDQINELTPTNCNVDGSQISVKHDLLLTMTDGKVCNALTDTRSPQKCYICGAGGWRSTMNEVTGIHTSNEEHYGFGLSTLHAWIRTFECMLHISYRLNIKKWQVRGDNDKAAVKQRSQEIQKAFKDRMRLIVDEPKPGYGNTNDGNTARRFFSNAELSSEITGLDVTLIRRFHVILRTLSSGYDINVLEIEIFCANTKKLYLDLYSWYSMPVTVHKILVHSTEVIKSCLLPIGQLSEEAQEARNKDCRRFRERHTRKRSRVATNTDLLRMLLITSDPVINTFRELPRKNMSALPAEVLQLIAPPSMPSQSSTSVCEIEEDDYLLSDSTDWESDDDKSSDDDC